MDGQLPLHDLQGIQRVQCRIRADQPATAAQQPDRPGRGPGGAGGVDDDVAPAGQGLAGGCVAGRSLRQGQLLPAVAARSHHRHPARARRCQELSDQQPGDPVPEHRHALVGACPRREHRGHRAGGGLQQGGGRQVCLVREHVQGPRRNHHGLRHASRPGEAGLLVTREAQGLVARTASLADLAPQDVLADRLPAQEPVAHPRADPLHDPRPLVARGERVAHVPVRPSAAEDVHVTAAEAVAVDADQRLVRSRAGGPQRDEAMDSRPGDQQRCAHRPPPVLSKGPVGRRAADAVVVARHVGLHLPDSSRPALPGHAEEPAPRQRDRSASGGRGLSRC